MKIYIVRHGQTDKNKEKRLQGRSNTQLNTVGESQCREVCAYFEKNGIKFSRVYSSPLDRAKQTASLISGEESAIITDDRLLEMDYGPYEGISLADPPQEIKTFFKDFVNNPAPDGMEPLSDVVKRTGHFLEDIKSEENIDVLAVTHAIAMKGRLEYLTPDSKGSYWSKFIGNCAVYVTEYTDGHFTVPYEIKVGEEEK